MLKGYIEYLKNNPQGYWFKRKPFGWGWTPAKWQGWVVILAYVFVVFVLALQLDDNVSDKVVIYKFFIPMIVATVILLAIAYKTGEKPKWTWGFPKSENHNQASQGGHSDLNQKL